MLDMKVCCSEENERVNERERDRERERLLVSVIFNVENSSISLLKSFLLPIHTYTIRMMSVFFRFLSLTMFF